MVRSRRSRFEPALSERSELSKATRKSRDNPAQRAISFETPQIQAYPPFFQFERGFAVILTFYNSLIFLDNNRFALPTGLSNNLHNSILHVC